MRNITRLLGVGASMLALSLAGCKEWRIDYSSVKQEEATVTWKEHKDAYNTTILMPMMIGKSVHLMPHSIYIPEKNNIVFRGEQSFDLNNSEIFNRFQLNDKAKVSYKEKYWSTYETHKNVYGKKERTLLKSKFLENEFVDAQKE
jgi:hypothetical protein